MKKIIIMVVGALVLVAASVGGTLFFTGAFSQKTVAQGADQSEQLEEVKPAVTHYYEFKPEFIANLSGKSRARFFMAELSVSTEDEDVLEVLDEHNPELRNDLLMLFSDQDGMLVSTAGGKNTLREKTLETVRKIVEKHYGKPSVTDVFFTRFVVQ